MKKRVVGSVFAAILMIAGCSQNSDEPTSVSPSPETPTATESTPVETESESSASATQSTDEQSDEIPDRADQTDSQRAQMEAWYLGAVKDLVDVSGVSDDTLVSAGDSVCDALDEDRDFEASAKGAAIWLVGDDVDVNEDAHYAVAVAAIRSLCPEHEDEAS